MISIVSPVFNEEENLVELTERISNVFKKIDMEYEIILVENGSSDKSLEKIKAIRAQDQHIKFIKLSRNFGHQGGLFAGLCHAKGDAVITLDGDLQHPPELIEEMVNLWKSGYEVIFTKKKDKKYELSLRFQLSRIFYKIISLISDLNLSFGQSDFRLLDRKAVRIICSLEERNKFLRGLVEWVGFQQIGIEYEVEQRRFGESKFSLKNYVSFALDGIFSFSQAPLKVFLGFGLLIATACLLYAGFYFIFGILYLLYPKTFSLPPGWATIVVSILFLSSVQLIGIGILGEYIGRIFVQTKKRPEFIIAEKELD
ncbi:glycosyltransferase family 2 protein [Candidatus Riflebacteria bacterium]